MWAIGRMVSATVKAPFTTRMGRSTKGIGVRTLSKDMESSLLKMEQSMMDLLRKIAWLIASFLPDRHLHHPRKYKWTNTHQRQEPPSLQRKKLKLTLIHDSSTSLT